MSYGYTWSAWLAEMLAEAFLFCLVAILMSHAGCPTVRDIAALTVAVLTCFAISGYMITTWTIRLALRGRLSNMYPVIAPFLFLFHFEIMNLLVPDGLLDTHNRFVFRVFGSGVVVIVATAISLALKRVGTYPPVSS